MMNKFKSKWDIESNWQVIVIFIVFSVTGSAAMVVRKFVFGLVGITHDTSLWVKVPLYILILVPAYQLLLLVIGGLLGQFQFFYKFQKRNFQFLNRKKA